jgi:hypothetical protein
MKKLSGTVVLAMVLTLSLSSFAKADEEDALKALEKIKSNTQDWITYGNFSKLLDEAKGEFKGLRTMSKNTKFVDAAEDALNCYIKVGEQWRRRNQLAQKFLKATGESSALKMMIINNEEVIREKWRECAPLVDAVPKPAK